MEATLSHIISPQFSASLYKPRARNSQILSQPIHNQYACFLAGGHRSRELRSTDRPLVECLKMGPVTVPEFEKRLEEDMEDLQEEWKGIGGKWMEKCNGGGGGIVELMECLEREAIMGEDEGREPTDYHRRAHIFDKSSRVFQALKEQNNHPEND